MQYLKNRNNPKNLFQDGLLQIILGNAFILLLTSPTLERYEVQNLFFHIMIEHILYLSTGFLFASGTDSVIKSFKYSSSNYQRQILQYYSKYLVLNNRFNPFGIIKRRFISSIYPILKFFCFIIFIYLRSNMLTKLKFHFFLYHLNN